MRKYIYRYINTMKKLKSETLTRFCAFMIDFVFPKCAAVTAAKRTCNASKQKRMVSQLRRSWLQIRERQKLDDNWCLRGLQFTRSRFSKGTGSIMYKRTSSSRDHFSERALYPCLPILWLLERWQHLKNPLKSKGTVKDKKKGLSLWERAEAAGGEMRPWKVKE